MEKPDGRFNNWGERKWLAVPNAKQDIVYQELSKLNLSERAVQLFRAAKLTDSSGVEFVFFTNAQLPLPIGLNNGLRLVPCFLPFDPDAPKSDPRQKAMSNRGVFIYDGWIPITEWTVAKTEQTITLLDDICSLFSLVGKYHATWEPKYDFRGPPIPSHLFDGHDAQALTHSLNILNQLPPEDRKALSRSIAWISSAKRTPPIPRFLQLFVSIESLITYIERTKKRDGSILQEAFSGQRPSPSERKRERDDCIKKAQEEASSLVEGIERAYKDCVQPSIKKKLEEHINRIFGNENIGKVIFEEEVSGKTLWQLRNDIAHGNLNMLNEDETRFIRSKVKVLEKIARNYLQIIFESLVQKNYFPATQDPILTLSFSQAFGSEHTKYDGPTDMAQYYLQIEALSSSYLRESF